MVVSFYYFCFKDIDPPPKSPLPNACSTALSPLIPCNARFEVGNIKDFYLNTLMTITIYEYMHLHISTIPQEIINQNNLRDVVTPDGWIYIKIRKGVYGLKQAEIIANRRLTKHIARHDYHPTPRYPGLWHHSMRNVIFSFVVDDFGIRYVGKEHIDHLLNALAELYTVSTDWTGSLYCALTIKWNYAAKYIDISMPKYIKKQRSTNSNTPLNTLPKMPHIHGHNPPTVSKPSITLPHWTTLRCSHPLT
jgi:hypothetical protein